MKQIYKLLKHPCQKEKSVIEEITSAYLEFVEDLFDYLNKFFINIESDWKSPFYLNNEVIKIIDIMELVCGIFYIKDGIVRIDNKDIFLSDVARIFEKMFNINFGDIYKKEIAVIKRKPTKITEFLDNLKVAIIKKSKDSGYNHL